MCFGVKLRLWKAQPCVFKRNLLLGAFLRVVQEV